MGGGVSANQLLRDGLEAIAERHDVRLRLPKQEYCVDNAAMIAGLAYMHLQENCTDDWSLTASAQRYEPTRLGEE